VGGESAITSRAYLQSGAANADTGIVTVASYTPGRAKTINPTVKSGWYFDFPAAGERQVNGGSVSGSKWMFSTLTPAANASTVNCGTTTAGGTQYAVDMVTGGGTSGVSTVGILGALLLLDMSGSTVYSPVDSTGRKTKTILTKVIQQGSGGLAESTLGGFSNDSNCPPDTPAGVICTRVVAGRLSWRQVNNYHALQETTGW
jgi:type IV pilus assembly protein PilY1